MRRKERQGFPTGLGDAYENAGRSPGLVRREMAASILGISLATLARMVRKKRVPVVRVLGRPRFRVDDLLALREPQ